MGEMYNVSGRQSKGHFYMLNMDTHGGTHTCTHTHTHTEALTKMPTNCQLPLLGGAHWGQGEATTYPKTEQ